MALTDMDFTMGNYGGLKSTFTWSDAVANAKSYIVVYVPFNDGTYERASSILIPKTTLSTNLRYYVGGGATRLNNTTFLIQCGATITSIITDILVNDGGVQPSGTIIYFYD